MFHFQDSGSQHDTLDSRPMALEKYERVWQQKIFIPSFNEIENEVKYINNNNITTLHKYFSARHHFPTTCKGWGGGGVWLAEQIQPRDPES